MSSASPWNRRKGRGSEFFLSSYGGPSPSLPLQLRHRKCPLPHFPHSQSFYSLYRKHIGRIFSLERMTKVDQDPTTAKNLDILPFISFMEINQWKRDNYRDRLIGKDFQIRKYIDGKKLVLILNNYGVCSTKNLKTRSKHTASGLSVLEFWFFRLSCCSCCQDKTVSCFPSFPCGCCQVDFDLFWDE